MSPCCGSLIILIIGICALATPFGPRFSSHVWSTSCVAAVCPRERLSLGNVRWKIAGKKASMLEKLWGAVFGLVMVCLLVKLARSMAIISPEMVTIRALSLSVCGMVIMGVFFGIKFETIIRPAIILPHASRLIGLITKGLFSLMGERGRNRGCPIEAKKIIRKL